MIAVIADDFTGAAEIAGVALRTGLDVKIVTDCNNLPAADLLIAALDTRSGTEISAAEEVSAACRKIARLKPEAVFKKVDSVFRGHFLPEIKVALHEFKLKRALLVPANPGQGRKILNGLYFIDDIPLHQTAFATDPEFPAKSSCVSDLLKTNNGEVLTADPGQLLPEDGIIAGNAATTEDMDKWAGNWNAATMLVGSSGLFNAFINGAAAKSVDNSAGAAGNVAGNSLYISGTAFASASDRVKQVFEKGGPVSYMPGPLIYDLQPDHAVSTGWAKEIVKLIHQKEKAIIAIPTGNAGKSAVSAATLRNRMADVVKQVFSLAAIANLVIEGGSTAAAVIRTLQMTVMVPRREMALGVLCMDVQGFAGLTLTVKPGSYAWPENFWQF